jgi:hypothetical protein
MESLIAGYQPLDLEAIKKTLPKNIKKIQSDKELETEIADILVILKDTTSKYSNLNIIKNLLLGADWKKRMEACQRVQSIAYLFDDVCSGHLTKLNVNFYIS